MFRRLLYVNDQTKTVLTISTKTPEGDWAIEGLHTNGYALVEIAKSPRPRPEILSSAAHYEAHNKTREGIKTLEAPEQHDPNHPAHFDPSKIVLGFGDQAHLCRIVWNTQESAPQC